MPMGNPYTALPEVFVAASNASAREKQAAQESGGYVCDGDNDQVELNLALAASKNVRCSSGQFWCKEATGQAAVTGTADIVTDGADNLRFNNFAGFSASDWAEGDVGWVYDGDDGSGNTLEDNKEEGWFTVDNDPGTDGYIDMKGTHARTDTYTGVTLVKAKGAIMPLATGAVHLYGAHHGQTILTLDGRTADPQSCVLLLFRGNTPRHVYLHDIRLTGGAADNTAGTTHNAEVSGLVLSDGCWDSHVRNVVLWYWTGFGAVIMNSWGLDWTGAWIEDCALGCMFIDGTGNEGTVHDSKIYNGNAGYDGSGIILRNCMRLDIHNLRPVGGYGVNSSAIEMRGCSECHIRDNQLRIQYAGVSYGIRLLKRDSDVCSSNTILGNQIGSTNAANVGISFHAGTAGNDVSNNKYVGLGTPIERTGYWSSYDRIQNNRGNAQASAEDVLNCVQDYTIKLNDTGGTLAGAMIVQGVSGSPDEMAIATSSAGDCERFLGFLKYGTDVADGSRGYVITEGYVLAKRDGASVAISDGDWLTNSSAQAGHVVKATAGDLVLAESAAANANTEIGTHAVRVVKHPFVML